MVASFPKTMYDVHSFSSSYLILTSGIGGGILQVGAFSVDVVSYALTPIQNI